MLKKKKKKKKRTYVQCRLESLKGEEHVRDLGIDGRVLEYASKEQDMWTDFICVDSVQ
jgi:hypothetical protein